ncbi:hypothetical protein OG21DRAFT_1115346 [Imleria badia]|nr:hypothetical protein OG21DRAFT_1115346 [Imleria badia]
MLDKMIKAVDEELSEDGLTSVGDTMLPHIAHWDRLVTLLGEQAVGAITVLPGVIGVSTLAILAVIALTPVYLSARVYKRSKRLVSHYLDARMLENLRVLPTQGKRQGETDLGAHKVKRAPDEDHGEGPSGGHGGESSQGVVAMHAESSGDTQSTTNATSQE